MRSTITISLILLFCPFVTGFICGIRGNGTVNGYFEKPSNDIYGGCYTIPGEYPWQALLWLTYNDGHQFICGATLISDEFLLTSASCVTNATQIQVKLGIVDQMKGTPYNVFKVTIHPEYNSSYFLNNIAVIQLINKVTFNESIQPICLPTHDEDLTNRTNFVTGWGYYSINCFTATNGPAFNETYQMLLQAFVPVVNNTVCSQESHFPLDQLTNRTLCAGTNVSGGARGDYGGPLQAPDGSNRWFLTGIFSNMLTYPPTGMDPLRWYMRTSAYCDFIRDVTQGEVYCVDPNKNETITTVTSTMPTSTTSTTTSTTTKTNPNMFTTTIIFSIFMFILCNLL